MLRSLNVPSFAAEQRATRASAVPRKKKRGLNLPSFAQEQRATQAAARPLPNLPKGGSNPAPAAAAAAAKEAATAASAPSRGDLISQYNLARAEILKGMAPQVAGFYNDAQSRLQGAVSPLTQGLRDSLLAPVPGLNRQFEGSGLIQNLGTDAYAGLAQPSANAAYALGAAIPSESLLKQGAAFGSAAAFAPERALTEGQYALQAAQAAQAASGGAAGQPKASASLSKALGVLVDVYGQPITGKGGKPITLPKETLSPYQEASLGIRQGQIDYQRYTDSRDYRLAVDKANQTNARYYAGLELRSQDSKARLRKANIDARRIDSAASKVAGYIVLKNGKVPRQKNGQPYAVAKTGSSKSASAKTRSVYQTDKLDKLVAEWKAGGKVTRTSNTTTRDVATGESVSTPSYGIVNAKPVNYQAALRKLMKSYGLKLRDATGLLDAHYERGEQGRPYLSLMEVRKLNTKKYRQWGINRALLAAAWRGGATKKAYEAYQSIDAILTAHGE